MMRTLLRHPWLIIVLLFVLFALAYLTGHAAG